MAIIISVLIEHNPTLLIKDIIMADQFPVLPGSEVAMTCGVNLPLGSLYAFPVFTRKADDELPITYIDKQFQNIVGTNAVSLNDTVYDSTSRLYKTTNDFQRTISKSYNGKLSYGGLSAGAGVKITNTVRSISEQKRSFLLQNGHLIGYCSQRIDTSLVSDAFITAYKKLPDSFSKESNNFSERYSSFKTFFEKWGTHYVESGSFGGFFSMITYVDDSEITNENTKKIERDVSIGFKKNTDSGEFSATNAQEEISKQNESLKSASVFYTSVGGGDLSDLKTFLSSCRKSPVLMVSDGELSSSTFEPLSSLVEDQDRSDAFDSALKYYSACIAIDSGIISSSSPVSESLQTTSENSQLILSTFNMLNWRNAQGTIEVQSPVNTPNSYASISSYRNDKKKYENVACNSGLATYKAGDTYASKSTVKGSVDVSRVSSYVFGYPDLIGFGERQGQKEVPTKDSTEYTFIADKDGILSAGLSLLDENANKTTAANLTIFVDDQLGSGEILSSACSIFGPKHMPGSLSSSSCAIPVSKGSSISIKVNFEIDSSPSSTEVFWSFIPILDNGLTKLGSPVPINFDTKVKADTDGFLSVYLKADEGNLSRLAASGFCSRGSEGIMTAEEQRFSPYKSMDSSAVDTQAQVTNSPDFILTPYATYLLPIPKGSWYMASVQHDHRQALTDKNARAIFYPLEYVNNVT